MTDYQPPREDKIRALMQAANTAMRVEAADATVSELLSAVMSLAAVTIEAAVSLGMPVDDILCAIEELKLRYPQEKGTVH